MALQLITAPTAQPLDLLEAKAHIRVDVSDDDLLIDTIIPAVTGFAESLTKKQLVAARLKQVQDAFYGCDGDATIRLQRFPVVQVISIQYLDLQGATQTVDPTMYTVDYSTEPVRITPVFGQVWPIPVPQIGAVWINFDAGYAAPITADATSDTVTVRGWKALAVGDVVRFSNSGGALPGGLVADTDYYVQSVVSAGVYTLSATSGGGLLDITSTGTGTSFLGDIPKGITAWMKLRLGAIYENREEEVIASRLTIATLTFVDRMLDGFTVYEF